MRLVIVIVNYQTPALVADCLASLSGEIDRDRDRVVVVDNGSGDGSVARLEQLIGERGWGDWAGVRRVAVNGGFAAGNNRVLSTVDADAYLLLNSDTVVRRGALTALVDALRQRPAAGIIGPRLEQPDGTPRVSCFRYPSAVSEFLDGAATGPLSRALWRHDVPLPHSDATLEPPWISFACALIRRAVIETVGLLDEGYFMYFEDVDYCRRARQAGWHVLYWPAARVVHLPAGLSARQRRPHYFYASRARYFAKFHGRGGLWMANVLWTCGRAVSLGRQRIGDSSPHLNSIDGAALWTNWRNPMRPWTIADGVRPEGQR